MQVYDPLQRLIELDTRHNELLDRLEALDREVADVLSEWTSSRPLITVSGDPNVRLVRDGELAATNDATPFDAATTLIVERAVAQHEELVRTGEVLSEPIEAIPQELVAEALASTSQKPRRTTAAARRVA
ncbi:MAG: hypothetical protein ACRC46_05295 [Thermoguttaceae bacterium]